VLLDERREDFTAAAEAFRYEYTAKLGSRKEMRPLVCWRYQDEKQLEELLSRLPAEEPAAVFLAADADAVWRLRSRKELAQLPILFAGDVGSDAALLASRLTSDGIYLVTAWTPDVETKQNQEFVQLYQKEFQRPPDVHAALAYDTARLLFAALPDSTESITSASLQEYWNKLKDFPGLTGPISFAYQHTLQRPAFLVQLRSGELVILEQTQPAKQ
jgi:branched-chain amino acid transport system substrate-binding protein